MLHTRASNFHLLTYILATNVNMVPNNILPAEYPTTAVNDSLFPFNKAPAIGVPVNPLTINLNRTNSTTHTNHGTYFTETLANTRRRRSL